MRPQDHEVECIDCSADIITLKTELEPRCDTCQAHHDAECGDNCPMNGHREGIKVTGLKVRDMGRSYLTELPVTEGWWARNRRGSVQFFNVRNPPAGLAIFVATSGRYAPVQDFSEKGDRWCGPIRIPDSSISATGDDWTVR